MNIFAYVTCFFPEAKGLTYDAWRLAQVHRARGISVSFLVSERRPDCPREDSYLGFPVSFFALSPPGFVLKIPGVIDFMIRACRKRADFDILLIYGGTPVAILLGWLVKKVLRKKVIVRCAQASQDTPVGLRDRRFGGIAAKLLNGLDAVVVMSTVQQKNCNGFPGLVVKIPNGVDTDRFQPVDANRKARLRSELLGITDDVVVLLYAGWFGYRKGTDILFAAWQEIRRHRPEVTLLCVGDFVFSSRDELRVFLSDCEIDPTLVESERLFLVAMTEVIHQYMQASDIFIFPSREEGFGTVQVEAMACGLPCVVHDLVDLSDAIFPSAESGIRIKRNDPVQFAQAVDDLIGSPQKRLEIGSQARKQAVNSFSLESIAADYAALYVRLLAS